MKKPRLKYILILFVLIILAFVAEHAFAKKPKKPKHTHVDVTIDNSVTNNITNNYSTTEEYFIDESTHGISGSEYHSYRAQGLAADAIHCTTSTRKHQMGVGTGYSDGQNGFAIGYCKVVSDENPVMIGVQAMGGTDAEPEYNVGVNWTF